MKSNEIEMVNDSRSAIMRPETNEYNTRNPGRDDQIEFEGGDKKDKLYRKKSKHTGKNGPFLNDSGFFYDYN